MRMGYEGIPDVLSVQQAGRLLRDHSLSWSDVTDDAEAGDRTAQRLLSVQHGTAPAIRWQMLAAYLGY